MRLNVAVHVGLRARPFEQEGSETEGEDSQSLSKTHVLVVVPPRCKVAALPDLVRRHWHEVRLQCKQAVHELDDGMVFRNSAGSLVPLSISVSDAFDNGERVSAYAQPKQENGADGDPSKRKRPAVVQEMSSKKRREVHGKTAAITSKAVDSGSTHVGDNNSHRVQDSVNISPKAGEISTNSNDGDVEMDGSVETSVHAVSADVVSSMAATPTLSANLSGIPTSLRPMTRAAPGMDQQVVSDSEVSEVSEVSDESEEKHRGLIGGVHDALVADSRSPLLESRHLDISNSSRGSANDDSADDDRDTADNPSGDVTGSQPVLHPAHVLDADADADADAVVGENDDRGSAASQSDGDDQPDSAKDTSDDSESQVADHQLESATANQAAPQASIPIDEQYVQQPESDQAATSKPEAAGEDESDESDVDTHDAQADVVDDDSNPSDNESDADEAAAVDSAPAEDVHAQLVDSPPLYSVPLFSQNLASQETQSPPLGGVLSSRLHAMLNNASFSAFKQAPLHPQPPMTRNRSFASLSEIASSFREPPKQQRGAAHASQSSKNFRHGPSQIASETPSAAWLENGSGSESSSSGSEFGSDSGSASESDSDSNSNSSSDNADGVAAGGKVRLAGKKKKHRRKSLLMQLAKDVAPSSNFKASHSSTAPTGGAGKADTLKPAASQQLRLTRSAARSRLSQPM